MRTTIIEELKRDLQPVRPLRPAWQITVIAICIAVSVGLGAVWIFGFGPPESFSLASWALLAFGFTMTVGGCAWAAAQWMSPSGDTALWRPALGFLVALAGILVAAEFGPFMPILALGCFSAGSLAAFATAALLLLVFRRAAPIRRHRVAACAGVVSGMVGFFAIQLHCPIDDAWHMLTGHALLPVAWGLAAYLLARLFWRA